jgi:Predicted membrane protein
LQKSCVSINDDVPFHAVRKDKCKDNPIDATLTMTMCNKNQNGNIITPYPPVPENSNKVNSTYFRFNASDFMVPYVFDDILQSNCKTLTRQVQIDTCRKKWPMSVQLNGNMTKSVRGNSYCYCYLFRKSVIRVFPAPPNPSPPTPPDVTKAPTAAPTVAPTAAPTVAPTAAPSPIVEAYSAPPTKKASQFPTIDITSMPSSSPVPLKPIILTEITDPAIIGGSPNDIPRFVEMYVPDVSIHGDAIKDNLKLVIFPGSSTEPDWSTAFDLKGKTVDLDGFVTLCNEAADGIYIDACSYVAPKGSSSPVNVDGCYNIAIVEGDANEYTIVDMYGIPGRVCTGTISDFSDGRAVRLDNSTFPNSPWDQYNWEVIKDEDIDGIEEPGDWNPGITPCDPSDIIITEVAYPNGLASSRYVELYLPQCAGQRIKPGIKLVRWPEGSNQPSVIHIALQDVIVPKDGFIIICQSLAAESTFSDLDLCDVIGGNRTPLGTDSILVVDGPIASNISGMNVIDSYGFPGSSGTLSSDFTNGRAVRYRPAIPTNSGAVWNPSQWIVYPSNDGKNVVGPEGMDPRVWVNPIIITEITDPDIVGVNPVDIPRFVEMYIPDDNLRMKPVKDNLKLVVFPGSSKEPDWSTAFNLKGKMVNSKGFITLCNPAGGQRYDELCDYVAFSNTAVNFDGCYNVGIVQGDSERYSVVDMYGIIGSSCVGTITDFSDGRAVRLQNTTYPESAWDQYNWEIIKGEDIDDIQDPGDWNPDITPCDPRDIIITELSDPKSRGLSRYIELYLPLCAGQRIKPGVKLIRWPELSAQPSMSHVVLQDVVVPKDGFILVCRSVQALQTFSADTCEIFAGDSTPSGKDAVAVVIGDNIQSIPSSDFIDSYGYPGSSSSMKSPSDFTDGRAMRLKPINPSNSGQLWKPEQWLVYPGNDRKNPVGPEGMDPRVWINPVILTEITDPSTDSVSPGNVPRLVEMYFSDNHVRGEPVQDNLKLVVFPGAATEPDWSTAFDLKGKFVGTDGFITVCNGAGSLYYGQLCDFASSSGNPNPADYDGCYNVAIIQGDETSYNIVDMYGVIGYNCRGTESDFSDGRAVRLTNATYPESSWERYHWRIIKGADPDMADPHQWVDDILPSFCNLIITELASPIDSDNARYIELYSDNCAGRTIGDDFKVVHYDGGDGKPEPEQIDLEGLVIGDDGFLVLCTTIEANIIYDGKCDFIVGKNTPADNDGNESVAIVLETPSGELGVVDIYGKCHL